MLTTICKQQPNSTSSCMICLHRGCRYLPGVPKKTVHKFGIKNLCSENRSISKVSIHLLNNATTYILIPSQNWTKIDHVMTF